MITERVVEKYNQLGYKTLFLFMLKRSGALCVFIFGYVALLFFKNVLPLFLETLLVKFSAIGMLFIVVVFIGTFFIAWLEYSNYGIFIEEENFKMTQGIFNQETIGIPYKLIKEVKIERSLFDQLLGVSNVVLIILGEDDQKTILNESVVLLPMLDQHIASRMQDEILKRAQVEEVQMSSR